MEFIDTHCHLQFKDLKQNIEQVIKDAGDAGVKRLVCVGTSLEDSQEAVSIADQHSNVWASVGAHPHDGADFLKHKDSPQILNKLSKLPKVVAIGEIGLDYYHENTDRDEQKKILRAQIEATLDSGLPYIFHVRDAWSDFWQIFDEYQIKNGVIHSFAAGTKQLKNALSRNLYIGLNGIMTFTRDQSQLEAAKQVPKNRILLETDAPFLTPAPNRDELCEPKHVKVTAEFLADLRGESLEELANASTKNAQTLFDLETK